MKKINTPNRSIVVYLLAMLVLINLFGIWFSIHLFNDQKIGILFIHAAVICICLYGIVNAVIDFIKKDFRIQKGTVIKKFKHGNKILLLRTDGKERKFRLTYEQKYYVQEQDQVELRMYKRTHILYDLTIRDKGDSYG